MLSVCGDAVIHRLSVPKCYKTSLTTWLRRSWRRPDRAGPVVWTMACRRSTPDISALTEELLSKAGSSLVHPGGGYRTPDAGFEATVPSQSASMRIPTVEECLVPPPPMSPYAARGNCRQPGQRRSAASPADDGQAPHSFTITTPGRKVHVVRPEVNYVGIYCSLSASLESNIASLEDLNADSLMRLREFRRLGWDDQSISSPSHQ